MTQHHRQTTTTELLDMVTGYRNAYLTLYNTKAIISGKRIELQHHNRQHSKAWIRQRRPRTTRQTVTSQPTKRRANNIHRSRQKAIRLAITNSNPKTTVFYTLTYKLNQTSRKLAQHHHEQMLKRIQRDLGTRPAFIYTIEYQKRGAIHFHGLLFNMPFVPSAKFMKRYWKQGGVTLKQAHNSAHAIAYATKYMTKESENTNNVRMYSCSQGLKQPKEIYDFDTVKAYIRGAIERQYLYKKSDTYINSFTGSEVCYYTLDPP